MAKRKDIECAVCGEISNQYNIGMHVKKYHGLDPEQYKIDHGLKNPKTNKIMLCKFCGNECYKTAKKGVCSSPECKEKQKNIEKEEYIEKVVRVQIKTY